MHRILIHYEDVLPCFPYFFNLAPEEFDPVFSEAFLCFSVPSSFCVLFLFFSAFVFFSPFCLCVAVRGAFSPFCSPLTACFCPLFGALPFFFIKKRGVVQMVLLLGGFFSSLRFTLLNTNTDGQLHSHYQN